jgi:hypothetical protein
MQRLCCLWSVFVPLWHHVNADVNLKLSKLVEQYDSLTTHPTLILADLSESNRIVTSEFTDSADNSLFVVAARMMFRKGLETQLHNQARRMEAAVRSSIERESADVAERQELESALEKEVAMALAEVESTLDKRIQSTKTYHRIRQIQADLTREMVHDLRLQISHDIQVKINTAQHPASLSNIQRPAGGQRQDTQIRTMAQPGTGAKHSSLRNKVTSKHLFHEVASEHSQTASGFQIDESANVSHSPVVALHRNASRPASTVSSHDGKPYIGSAEQIAPPFTDTNVPIHRGGENSGTDGLHFKQEASKRAPPKPTVLSSFSKPAIVLKEASQEHVRPSSASTKHSQPKLSLQHASSAELAFAQSSEEDDEDGDNGGLFSAATIDHGNEPGLEPHVHAAKQQDDDLTLRHGAAQVHGQQQQQRRQEQQQEKKQQQHLGENFAAAVVQPMRRFASWLSMAWISSVTKT